MDELKPLLDLAFSEGGNALFWILLGGTVAVLIGLAVLFALAVIASKHKWPRDTTAGKWCRRIFVAYCVIAVPAGAFTTGATWGLLVAIEKVLDSQHLVEKASEKALSPILVAISTVRIRPRVDQELRRDKWISVGASLSQLFVTVGLPALLIHLTFRFIKKPEGGRPTEE